MLRGIARLGHQFTARDMALELHRQDDADAVRKELDALLCEARGTYELSKDRDGEIVYQFPQDYRARLYGKRTLLWARDHLGPLALRGLRLFIGFFLVFSLVLCVVLLVLISMREGGGRSRHHNFTDTYNTFVLWSFWRRNPFFRDYDYAAVPQYHDEVGRTGATEDDSPRTSSLADEVFAFIFGAPRLVDDEGRWDKIKRAIGSHGFVVTAEQMRPFSLQPDADSNTFMGEICAGLGGVAEASDDGQKVVYRFEALRESSVAVEAASQAHGASDRYYREPEWLLFDRSVTLAVILGSLNLLALLALYPQMRIMSGAGPVRPVRSRLRGGAKLVFEDQAAYMRRTSPLVFYLLQLAYVMRFPLYAYGILYMLIPLMRYLICIKILNPRIRRRNELRAAAVPGRVAA